MKKQSGLGRGLGALLDDPNLDFTQQKGGVTTVPLHRVEPNPLQPRKEFEPEAMQALADSIAEHGLIQPLTVREAGNGYYQIIAGERRWRAARMAGLEEVPVLVIEADDRKVMELALVENLQREDLNPMEEAQGYKTLMDEYGLTQNETAQRVGKSRTAVANALRLLSLSDELADLVRDGTLSPGHARALIPITDEVRQQETADLIIKKNLTVRQTEALVNRLLKQQQTEAPKEESDIDYVKEVERELENALGRKVRLMDGRRKGRLVLEYYGAEDREKLIENLRFYSTLRRNRGDAPSEQAEQEGKEED